MTTLSGEGVAFKKVAPSLFSVSRVSVDRLYYNTVQILPIACLLAYPVKKGEVQDSLPPAGAPFRSSESKARRASDAAVPSLEGACFFRIYAGIAYFFRS